MHWICCFTRATPKVVSLILLRWPTIDMGRWWCGSRGRIFQPTCEFSAEGQNAALKSWSDAHFWDCKGVILLDFLEPRQTISSDCYIVTLTKLKTQTSGVVPGKSHRIIGPLEIESRPPMAGCREGESTTSLCGLFQCSVNLTVKKFLCILVQNFLCLCLWPFPLVLSPQNKTVFLL